MKALLLIVIFILGSVIASVMYALVNRNVPVNPVAVVSDPTPTPSRTAFSIENPPSESISGTITDISGDMWLVPRESTEPAKLAGTELIKQGEKLIASDSGQITVTFPQLGQMRMIPESEVDVVQTLPVDLVFQHYKGTTEYERIGTVPLSVRSFRLLVSVTEGRIRVTTDEEQHTVSVEVLRGQATAAYNNPEIISTLVTIGEGEEFFFNSDTREGSIL